MNSSALRNDAKRNRSAEVINMADYVKNLNGDVAGISGAMWSHYSAQAAILKVLEELRRERRALEKATRTLERLAHVRGQSSRRLRRQSVAARASAI